MAVRGWESNNKGSDNDTYSSRADSSEYDVLVASGFIIKLLQKLNPHVTTKVGDQKFLDRYLSINENNKNIFIIIIALILAYGIFSIIKIFISTLLSLDKEVTAAIIGSMATVFTAIYAIIYNKNKEISESHRKKKTEIYNSFIDAITKFIANTVNKNQETNLDTIDEKELAKILFVFKKELLLWGSPRVINAFLKFMNEENLTDVKKLFTSIDLLYKEIRQD